jgi:hypothetical protein
MDIPFPGKIVPNILPGQKIASGDRDVQVRKPQKG